MSSAEQVPLGRLATIVMGQAPPSSECNKDGIGVPFVKAGEFSDRQPEVREWTTSPLRMAAFGDVLVCVVGATAGKMNLGIDCAIGRSVAAVRVTSPQLEPGYLYRWMLTQVTALREQSQGLAQSVITKDMLTSLLVPLPSLEDQRTLVQVLDEVDRLRAEHRRALGLLEELDAAIGARAFT